MCVCTDVCVCVYSRCACMCTVVCVFTEYHAVCKYQLSVHMYVYIYIYMCTDVCVRMCTDVCMYRGGRSICVLGGHSDAYHYICI